MNRVFISLVLGVATIAGLSIFQMTRTTVSTVYLPSELAPRINSSIERIRVAGRVADLPIDYRVEPIVELRFSIQDPPEKKDDSAAVTMAEVPAAAVVPVVYQGVKPDMFAPGRDVIIDGHLENGQLVAVKLLTQCPSKYEAPKPVEHYKLDY
jgi:cytochrome c-type biogenesis protein CcmE